MHSLLARNGGACGDSRVGGKKRRTVLNRLRKLPRKSDGVRSQTKDVDPKKYTKDAQAYYNATKQPASDRSRNKEGVVDITFLTSMDHKDVSSEKKKKKKKKLLNRAKKVFFPVNEQNEQSVVSCHDSCHDTADTDVEVMLSTSPDGVQAIGIDEATPMNSERSAQKNRNTIEKTSQGGSMMSHLFERVFAIPGCGLFDAFCSVPDIYDKKVHTSTTVDEAATSSAATVATECVDDYSTLSGSAVSIETETGRFAGELQDYHPDELKLPGEIIFVDSSASGTMVWSVHSLVNSSDS